MIEVLIFAVIFGLLVAWILSKIVIKLSGRRLAHNALKSLQKQDNKFISDGKQLDVEEQLRQDAKGVPPEVIESPRETEVPKIKEEAKKPRIKKKAKTIKKINKPKRAVAKAVDKKGKDD